jgi:hypothetical protein
MLTALLVGLIAQGTPTVQVIDLDAVVPHRLVVIVDGEPIKVLSVPGGTVPGPQPPQPPPAPVEPVTPVTGLLWVTYIVAESATVVDTAPTTDPAIRSKSDNKAVSWRSLFATDQEINRRQFTEIVAAGLPVTVFQDANGKVLKTLRGSDSAAILSQIKRYKP